VELYEDHGVKAIQAALPILRSMGLYDDHVCWDAIVGVGEGDEASGSSRPGEAFPFLHDPLLELRLGVHIGVLAFGKPVAERRPQRHMANNQV
jgi:hypothetical protein